MKNGKINFRMVVLGIFLCWLAVLLALQVYGLYERGKEKEASERAFEEQANHYEKEIEKLRKQIEAEKGTETSPEEAERKEEQVSVTPTQEPVTEIEVNSTYNFKGFEELFSPFATQAQIDAMKNDITEAVKNSDYKNIKTVICSSYNKYDADKLRVISYARLDDKGVLEISYSIRYGKSSSKISEYKQSELAELEEHGVLSGYDENGSPNAIGEG